MDNMSTGNPIIIRKGGENMKKSLLSSSSILFSFASFFVIAAGILVRSGSILLWGEPKCPKSLLK
jgi:cyclic lactone autoinducer peptide